MYLQSFSNAFQRLSPAATNALGKGKPLQTDLKEEKLYFKHTEKIVRKRKKLKKTKKIVQRKIFKQTEKRCFQQTR